MSTQTDPNAAYDAKVKRIANVLATVEYIERNPNCQVPYQDISDRTRDLARNNKMAQARAMVAEMEQMFKDGFNSGMQLGLKDAGGYLDHKYSDELSKELSQRGLISNTKTDNDA